MGPRQPYKSFLLLFFKKEVLKLDLPPLHRCWTDLLYHICRVYGPSELLRVHSGYSARSSFQPWPDWRHYGGLGAGVGGVQLSGRLDRGSAGIAVRDGGIAGVVVRVHDCLAVWRRAGGVDGAAGGHGRGGVADLVLYRQGDR